MVTKNGQVCTLTVLGVGKIVATYFPTPILTHYFKLEKEKKLWQQRRMIAQ